MEKQMALFDMIMIGLMMVIALSMATVALRLVQGPTIPDRGAALDLIVNHIVGIIAIYVIVFDQPLLADAIIVISVLGFLGTVALARYIEEGRT
jgi:multicomponent Na+:H+ antiporter subunit F